MTTQEILAAIDEELARLQQVRTILSGGGGTDRAAPTAFVFGANAGARKRKPLSKAARDRIAAAQRKRWAKQKAAAKKAG